MTNMWSLILSSLLALLSQGAYIDSCSYVKTTTNLDALPLSHWGFVYPMDVCMTYVDSGAATYKKYVCNDAGELKEELWDTATCDSVLSSTQDPTAAVEEFSCDTYGECEYMTVRFSAVDCDTATTYKEEAIIPDVCVVNTFPPKAFILQCSDQTFNYYGAASCGGAISSSYNVASCISVGTLTGFTSFGFWDMASACLSITYSNPTSDPTQGPTMHPSINPSQQPSKQPTSNPSKNPSESPSRNPSESPSNNPSESPSKNPSATPSSSPSNNPSESPSNNPSESPSKNPSKNPSATPSSSPSNNPSESPSNNPSESPSKNPSKNPSVTPSSSPTSEPTVEPTANPSGAPSETPSNDPSNDPTETPSAVVVSATESSDEGGASYIAFIANVIIAIVLSLAI